MLALLVMIGHLGSMTQSSSIPTGQRFGCKVDWMVGIDLATDNILYTNNYSWPGHCVAQLWLIFRMVPPKGLTQYISNIFLTYAQHFDVVPHLNPKYSAHAGSFLESATSMFALKWAVLAGGAPLGDTVPVLQLHALADLIPRFGAQIDPHLTKQTSFAYSTEFWLNKYFNKQMYYALTLS